MNLTRAPPTLAKLVTAQSRSKPVNHKILIYLKSLRDQEFILMDVWRHEDDTSRLDVNSHTRQYNCPPLGFRDNGIVQRENQGGQLIRLYLETRVWSKRFYESLGFRQGRIKLRGGLGPGPSAGPSPPHPPSFHTYLSSSFSLIFSSLEKTHYGPTDPWTDW